MHFRIVSPISDVETIAAGTAIRERKRLQKFYGKGRWRKRKGIAEYSFLLVRYAEPRYAGTKRMASEPKNTRLSAFSKSLNPDEE